MAMSSLSVHVQTRRSAYQRTVCFTSVFLIATAAYTQATGISKCNTKEIRKSVLDKMLVALQCDDYVCALNRVRPGLNASFPAASCTQILGSQPNPPSRNYWLQSSNGSAIHIFCDMTLFPCQPGFSEEGGTCRDVDECTIDSHSCDTRAECINTLGNFTCECQSGYAGDGMTCNDIDECTNGDNSCDVNAVCTNTHGSYTCTCQFGYSGDGVICEDINECHLGMDNCDARAVCINTVSSFSCTCEPGYIGDGVTCNDIDECASGTDNCDTNAVCVNTHGSFTCTCQSGYAGNGVNCDDVHECIVGSDDCSSNAMCTNTIGSYVCQCRSGYSGNGVTCNDINECIIGTDNCDARAVCANTVGSFTCTCQIGYIGNGMTCSDINECAVNTDNCNANAACINTHGSFICQCRSGYSGNGVICNDVNECAIGTDYCHTNAICTNTVGSFYCTCLSGYAGNGITCAFQWPDGTYSLPQAVQGCPSGWYSGWRLQDNEDSNNANYWSPSDLASYMRMDLDRNYRTYYCTKSFAGNSGSSAWPRGHYCIARYGGSCPSGFFTGSKYWDDEDNSNINSKQDPIPDGSYDSNTNIKYCCRSDGSASVGIELPTSQPFVLYRYGGTCQIVNGMIVRELHVHFDDEDSANTNSCSGRYPDDSSCDSNHDMYFCYYS